MAAAATADARAAAAVRVAAHPLRMQIINYLVKEGPASPNEMAKAFGQSLPLVSYHVRILRESDAITLVGTTPRRGAIEHHYEANDFGHGIHERFGAPPVNVENLTGANLVLRCEKPDCRARHAIPVGEGAEHPGAYNLIDYLSEQWPEGWGFDQATGRRPRTAPDRVLHCPVHRA